MTGTLTLNRPAMISRGILAGSLAFALLGVGAAGYAIGGTGTTAIAGRVVSQANRTFTPNLVDVATGDTLTVFNDDAGIVHHAYVDAADFRYDSGDQEPGDRAPITFGVPGTFQVMCGIHPRMSLTVRVTPKAGAGPDTKVAAAGRP